MSDGSHGVPNPLDRVGEKRHTGAPVTALSTADLEACRAILAQGSKSFAFASRALPARMRDPVAAFYAFCRVSDDAVDESATPRDALARLNERVDAAAAGRPESDPVDRALAWLMGAHALPRVPIDALLEGYLWDAEGRSYETLSETMDYCARVASSVGVAMTALMGVRDAETLARAADLGVAMQLTNIARDVGQDARIGRLYVPRAWLREEGVDPDGFLGAPRYVPGVGRATRRLLDHAAVLYARASDGIGRLPRDCRIAIRGAGRIYEDIGREIRARDLDSVGGRAFTSTARKAWLLSTAVASELRKVERTTPGDGPLAETAFLVDACAVRGPAERGST